MLLPVATPLVNPLFARMDYTGTGAAKKIYTRQNLKRVGGLTLSRNRGAIGGNWIIDSERGAAAALNIADTAAENASAGYFDSLDTFGHTVSSAGTLNANGSVYEVFSWLIESGYLDIVLHTGTGIAGTAIPHGLGVAPKMLWGRNRSGGGHFGVYHSSLGASKYILMNTSAAAVSSTDLWAGSTPLSAQFSVGDNATVNALGEDYVFYLFGEKAGRSKFSIYSGNGASQSISASFRPRAALVKSDSTASDWYLFYERGGVTYRFSPNTIAAEVDASASTQITASGLDVSSLLNTSGQTYIYAFWQ